MGSGWVTAALDSRTSMFNGADWLLKIGVLTNDSLTIEDDGTLPLKTFQTFPEDSNELVHEYRTLLTFTIKPKGFCYEIWVSSDLPATHKTWRAYAQTRRFGLASYDVRRARRDETLE